MDKAASQEDAPGKLLVDRRAHRLIDVDFHPETRLTTKQVAVWLEVSEQFLEIKRTRGGGPRFERITNKLIRYRAGDVIEWLRSRAHAATSEYAKGGR
jgi:hypothetical protein